METEQSQVLDRREAKIPDIDQALRSAARL